VKLWGLVIDLHALKYSMTSSFP